jgi:hypothetical protein
MADFAEWSDSKTIEDRRLLAIGAAMTRHQTRGKDASVGPLVGDLRAMRAADPDSAEFQYHLTTALLQLARELREQMRGAARERRQALREQLEAARKECEENAAELSAENTLDPEKRDYIREILDAIRPK